MARTPKAGIDVAVNEKPAIAGLKRLTKEFGDTAIRINQAAELAGKAWSALTSVVGGAISVVEQSVKLAMEQERVERRAIAAISAKVDLTQAEFEALQASNAERQRALGIGDEVQLQLQGTLAALGVQKQQLDAATEATIGLAQITGQGLPEAAKAVGKALAGNVGVLKEYGIQAISVADAQAQLAAAFRLSEAQSDSLQTRLAVLEAAWGDLQEVIGSSVTRSGAAADMVKALTGTVEDLIRYLDSSEGRAAVDGFFRLFASSAAIVIDTLEDLRIATRGLFVGIGEAVADMVHGSVRQVSQQTSALRELAAQFAAIGSASVNVRAAPGATPGMAGRGGAGGGRRGGGLALGEIEFLGTDREQQFREEWAVMEGFKTALAEQSAANQRERQEIEAQVAREALDYRNELHMQAGLLQLETSASMQTAELEQLVAHHQAIRDAEQRQADAIDSLGGRSVGIFSDQLSEMVVAAASGEQSIKDALGGFVRGMMMQIGSMLISTGMAALALQALSFIPGLWGITGPPGLGVAPALAAIGLGTALVAGSSFISGGARASTGGGSSGGGGMARAPQAPRASRMEDVMPRGFGGLAMAGEQPYMVNISFSGVVGDERRAARMIEDVLRRGRR